MSDLTKDFGSIRALNRLSLKVEVGEIFGLIGPNGAGKTTALRVIATLLLPTSGSVEVFGLDIVHEAAGVRKIIAYLPEEAGAYPNLSGWEYLEFMAKFGTNDKNRVHAIVSEAAVICEGSWLQEL
jgi:ABC-2 type transport system ATP-binding protein